LVRVVAPRFVAGFLTDGVVRQAAPILKAFIGLTDAQARAVIEQRGWKARSLVTEAEIIQHEESFEVRIPPGKRKFFYFTENAGRRAITKRMTKEAALLAAQDFLRASQNVTPIKSD
jgi:hypothetical protein